MHLMSRFSSSLTRQAPPLRTLRVVITLLPSRQSTSVSALPQQQSPTSPPLKSQLDVYSPIKRTADATPLVDPSAPKLPHPVLRLMRERALAGSTVGKRTDGAKLGLVVEGGGMRGIISGAMLMELLSSGLKDVFDAVYGASAGAINSTYFLAGQAHGLDIYSSYLCDGRFLDLSRLLSRGSRPAMDLEYLLQEVMRHHLPLDCEAVITSPVPLKVLASNVDRHCPVVLEQFESAEDLIECLAASATVPALAGPPRMVRGQRLLDAALSEAVPVCAALSDGCTHVLALCSRPPKAAAPLGRRLSNNIVSVLRRVVLHPLHQQASLSETLLADAGRCCPMQFMNRVGGYVLPLHPAHTGGCHPVATDPAVLKRASAEGSRVSRKLIEEMESILEL